MKKTIFFMVITLNLFAQENYKQWLKKENEKFQSFLSEEDRKFYDFLKKDWKQFDLKNGIIEDNKPKPIEPPVYNEEPLVHPIEKNLEETKKNVKEQDVDIPQETPKENENVIQSPAIPPSNASVNPNNNFQNSGVVDFFFIDDNEEIYYPKEFIEINIGNMNNETIAEFWKKINSISLTAFINELNAYKERKKFNDWGFFKCIWKLSNIIYPRDKNEALLLTWILLDKTGYKVKVGMIDDKVKLFVKSKESIYDIPYFKDDNGEKTYIMDFENKSEINGKLFSYDGDYPAADKYLSLKINESPQLKLEKVEKEFVIKYGSIEYNIHATVNKNIVNYFKDYPGTQYSTFFEASVSHDVAETLLPDLHNIVKDMKPINAINFLLRFVQTCFGYMVDEQNFGREKSLFVEETLFYKYSDCEDRAILFAYLVRNVLSLKVIGIDYPGHMATAVAFNNDVIKGDYVVLQGIKYTICDPTYINANAGMSMPKYPVSKIENIIEIK